MHTKQQDNKTAQPKHHQQDKPATARRFKKSSATQKNKPKPKKKLSPSKARGSRCYNRCKDIWGNLFDLKKPKPFSLSIRNELIEDAKKRGIDISPSVIYTGLFWVVNTYVYQKAICNGGYRFDINGDKTTKLTDEHIAHAKQNSQKIKDTRKSSRKKTPIRSGFQRGQQHTKQSQQHTKQSHQRPQQSKASK